MFIAGLFLIPVLASVQEAPPVQQLPQYACAEPGTDGAYYASFSAEWSWHPGGEAIVYDRGFGEVSQLRVLDLTSGEEVCVTSGEHHDTQPNWSPDGAEIAFVRRTGESTRIFGLRVSDGVIRPLTPGGHRAEYPAISPSGKQLAYVQEDVGDPRRRFVMLRNLETGEERAIFDSPFGLNNLAWTSDGRAVTLYSIDDDWNDLYEANADGSGARPLTHNTVTDSYSSSYAPDGGRMVFGQGSEVSPYHRWFNYDLYEEDRDSGAVRRLTWALLPDDRARYSPDGETIGFVSRRTGYAEIYFMDADGRNLRQATRQPSLELTTLIACEGVQAGEDHLRRLRDGDAEAVPASERAVSVLVHQLLARGLTEDAVRVAEMGVDVHPESSWTQTSLGRALLAAGESEAGRRALRRSLAINPNQYQLVFDLGSTDFLGTLDSIENVYVEKALDVYELAFRLRTRGEILTGLRLLERLDAAHPNDSDVIQRLAFLQMTLGDHRSAVANFERALELDSGQEETRFHLERLGSLAAQGPGEPAPFGGPRLAPAPPDENHWAPDWSPDGSTVAYSVLTDDGYEIDLLDLATGESRRVTHNDADDWRPDWSPDGRRILFSSDRDGDFDLYAMDRDGQNVQRLTNNTSNENRVRFSPDGRLIAFDSDRSGSWGVYVMNADGTDERVVLDGPGFEGYPDWSPDGERIVFNSNRHDPEGGAPSREIYTMRLDGSDVRRLTDNPENDQAPAWSPDGRSIVFFSNRVGNAEIYVMRDDGSNETRLTENDEWDFMPAWSPDGASIVFDSRRDGRRSIYTMSADGSGARKRTDNAMSEFLEVAEAESVPEALRRLRASLELNPSASYFLPEELLAYGRVLIAKGQAEDGLALLEVTVEIDPGHVHGWVVLGEAYEGLGRVAEAAEAFERAHSLDGGNVRAEAGLQRTGHAVAPSGRAARPFVLGRVPVLEAGPEGSWDAGGVFGARVFSASNGLVMLYIGQAVAGTFDNRLALGMASSADTSAWVKSAANPILEAGPLLDGATGIEPPTILEREGDRVRLLLTLVGSDRLPMGWRAATVDLKSARVEVGELVEMERPAAEAWNGRFPMPESFLSPSGEARLLGSGCCGASVWMIGALRLEGDRLIWSPDPVFTPGTAGTWDRGQVFSPHVFARGGEWVMVYAGTPGAPESDEFQHTIGYAVSRDGLAWNRPRGDNRLLEPWPGHLIEYPFLLQGENGDVLFVGVSPHPAGGRHAIHAARGKLR